LGGAVGERSNGGLERGDAEAGCFHVADRREAGGAVRVQLDRGVRTRSEVRSPPGSFTERREMSGDAASAAARRTKKSSS
jgi:hypothetical protein